MTVGLLDIHAEQSTILIIKTCNKKKGKTCVFIWFPGHEEGIEIEITTEGGGGKGGTRGTERGARASRSKLNLEVLIELTSSLRLLLAAGDTALIIFL